MAGKKGRDTKEAYRKTRDTADAIIEEYPNPSTWSNVQLKIILASLKTKNDGAVPTLKKMLKAYKVWKNGSPPSPILAPEVVPLEAVPIFYNEENQNHNLLTNEEEVVAAMIDLGALSEV